MRITARFLLLCLAALPVRASDGITVNFDPPLGEATREYRMVAQTTIDEAPALSTLTQTQRLLKINQSRQGWTIESIPQTMRIDGLIPELDRQIQELLLAQTFTLHLSPDGNLKRVTGFDKLDAEVRQLIPAPLRKTVSSVLNADTQKQRVATNWDLESAWLLGKSLRIGQHFTQEHAIVHDGKTPLTLQQESVITAIEPNAPQPTLTVNFTSEAAPNQPLPPTSPLRSLTIRETGWRTISAQTGMPLEEEATRTITMTLANGDREIRQERTETRRVTYRYASDRD